jgi:hypothetical protein
VVVYIHRAIFILPGFIMGVPRNCIILFVIFLHVLHTPYNVFCSQLVILVFAAV